MQPQLLFFDIDGTLQTNYTHIIPESAIEAIRKAQANGHLAFVNTGRTIRSIPDEIQALPFDGFLYGCGTRIVYRGQTLLSHSFSMARGLELIDLMDTYNIEAFLEGSEDVYYKRAAYRQPMMNAVKTAFSQIGLGHTAFIEDRNFLYDKFCLVTDEFSQTDTFLKVIHHDIEAIPREHGMYECVPRGFSKAAAMQKIAEYLGISMENSYAFGDSSNDLTMFQAAAHGIAMGEHSPVLEPYSEFITDTVENDGIAKALQKIGLI
jgi:hypothetical protein